MDFAAITTFPFAMVAPFSMGTITEVPVVGTIPEAIIPGAVGRIPFPAVSVERWAFPVMAVMVAVIFSIFVGSSPVYSGTLGGAVIPALLSVLPVGGTISPHPGTPVFRVIRRDVGSIRLCFRNGICRCLFFSIYCMMNYVAACSVSLHEGNAVITAHIGYGAGRFSCGECGSAGGASQGGGAGCKSQDRCRQQ